MKTNGATPHQDAHDSTCSSERLLFGELLLFRIPLPHTRRTNQNRGDSGWGNGFWCGRLDEDNAHTTISENVREIARIVRRLPLSQRVDVSLLKRVKGLPWDGQGLVRRGRPPKLVLPELSMAETGRNISNWRIIACDEAATSQKQNSGSCSRRGNDEVEEHSVDTGHW